MPIVKFLPFEKEIEVTGEATILQAEQLSGIRQDAPCGGYGKCGKCKVWVDGKEVLACQTMIHEDMVVTVGKELGEANILSEGVNTEFTVDPVFPAAYHISVDIGTTTVVAYLLDGVSGEILGTQSMLNPQFPYGADVISRIQAALSGKMDELTHLIREGVWSLITQLCDYQKITPTAIGTVTIVANPAMQQLFMGITPENLSKPPFAPVFTKTNVLPLSENFPIESEGKLLVVPDIAGYVGADTMGCILATGMYADTKMTLMIDIGTNGEMVLGNCGKMVACSTAAGPALEGGRIGCGMRGSKGAIDHLWLDNGQLKYSVIGETDAQGICGSGIIDAVAVMLELGVLNKRGRIQKDYREEGKERIYDLTDKVSLSQEDIREVQMAKGAIAAGIELMMNCLEVTHDDIDQVVLCGAFGNYMRPESACKIGLLPDKLLHKIKSGGNAAGMGSRQMTLDKEKYYLTDTLLEKIEAIELATFPEFQRVYAANMMFKDK